MDKILLKLKQDIIKTMNLDIKPGDIADDCPIFGDGLGLDSIEALELIVLLEKEYKIKVTNEAVAKKIFVSVRTLANFIKENS